MLHDSGIGNDATRLPFPSLNEQADLAEKHGADTLLFCPDPWALRHIFINQQTGETIRARCNRWDCLFCWPRKVDQWRQLVKAAEPTLFITLSKAGKTVEEASRALTTFLQYVRRGSKGRGPNRIGVREVYLIEYFAVLERHSDFEENGFHWHLLVKGVDFVPHEVLREGWRSARHGVAYIVHMQAIRKPHVIGYVTKYLTKSLSWSEKGVRYEEREKTVHKDKLRVSSYVKYKKLIRYIDAELGNVWLQKLTPEQVRRFYSKISEKGGKGENGLASSTIHEMHGVLHLALKNAVRWGYISRNVCDLVEPPRIVSREVTPLTLEQAQALLKSVRKHRLEVLLTMAVVTGMRRGELLALRWSNIDFERSTLLVLHTQEAVDKWMMSLAAKRMVRQVRRRVDVFAISFAIKAISRIILCWQCWFKVSLEAHPRDCF